jgi:hypothetical protein
MKTIELNDTKQACYDLRVNYKGTRKRARKIENHSIKLIEGVELSEIVGADGELKHEAHVELIRLATKAVKEHAKLCKDITVRCDYVTRSKEGGFISTEFEPFGDNHIRFTFPFQWEV